MKMYAVITGCWGECSIEGIFSTRKKAEKYLDIIGKQESYIKEYSVDKNDSIIPENSFWEIRFDYNIEKIIDVHKTSYSENKDLISYINKNDIEITVEADRQSIAEVIAKERLLQVKKLIGTKFPKRFERVSLEVVKWNFVSFNYTTGKIKED